MRRCFAWILIGLLFALLPVQTNAEEPLRLRVLTYNIHHAEGVDGKLDVERIAQVILEAKPDLVALQEVDRLTQRTDRVDQAKIIAEQTKMKFAFGANIELQGGHYGNAILSRWPITHEKNHLLPNLDEGEQRGVLEVQIELPDDKGMLLFLATHLDHRRSDAERFASAEAINNLLDQPHNRPAILAGDFNDRLNSRTIKEVQKRWHRANTEELPSIPVAKPTRQIDYIFVQPQDSWKVVEVQVLSEATASDHRAVLAVMELVSGH